MRGLRLLSNLLWTAPLGAFWWWVVGESWDGIAGGDDRGGAAFVSLVFCLALTAALGFSVYHAVKAARDFDPGKPSARSKTLGLLFAQSFIFLLVAVSIPPSFDLLDYSNEGARKANLASVRAAFDSYSQKKGRPPRLEALVEDGALEKLPRIRYRRGLHPSTRESVNLAAGTFSDSGAWGYSVDASTPVFVDCTHTDHRGSKSWTNY